MNQPASAALINTRSLTPYAVRLMRTAELRLTERDPDGYIGVSDMFNMLCDIVMDEPDAENDPCLGTTVQLRHSIATYLKEWSPRTVGMLFQHDPLLDLSVSTMTFISKTVQQHELERSSDEAFDIYMAIREDIDNEVVSQNYVNQLGLKSKEAIYSAIGVYIAWNDVFPDPVPVRWRKYPSKSKNSKRSDAKASAAGKKTADQSKKGTKSASASAKENVSAAAKKSASGTKRKSASNLEQKSDPAAEKKNSARSAKKDASAAAPGAAVDEASPTAAKKSSGVRKKSPSGAARDGASATENSAVGAKSAKSSARGKSKTKSVEKKEVAEG